MGYIKTAVISLVVLCSLSVSAAATAETKIAVCDLAKAILGSEAAIKRGEELVAESNLAKLQARDEGIVADMEALKKDFDANSLSWDDARKAKAQREMTSYQSERQLLQRDAQSEQQAIQQTLVSEFQPVASELLQVILDEEKIDLLLKKEAVHWSKGALDITNKLIDRINKKSGIKDK